MSSNFVPFERIKYNETIYACYPTELERPKIDPKTIYINLGIRPQSSYVKFEEQNSEKLQEESKESLKTQSILTNEQRSTHNSFSENSSTSEVALSDESKLKATYQISDSKYLRAKSAIEVPSKRIILDIPKPQLKNIFDRLEKLGAETAYSKTVEQTEIKTRPKTCIETSRKQTSRPKTPNVVQVNNQGKYPILSSNELKAERRDEVQRESRSKTCMELNHKDNRFKSARNLKSKSALYRPKSVFAASNFHLNNEDPSRFASDQTPSNNFVSSNYATATSRSTVNELVVKDESSSSQQTTVQKPCCRVVDGHWKHELLNREISKRPKYFTRIDINKLKPDPEPPVCHYNASDTFFYNTLPIQKASFVINPYFISENLKVSKMHMANRNAAKFRRDYAFIY